MKTLNFRIMPLLVSAFFIFVAAVDPTKETERINKATEVLTSFSQLKENIPHQLLKGSEGVVIIPKLINAGLGVGGKRGKGVAMVKIADGRWSDPVFVTLTGGSIGAQIGVQAVDLVLVFKHKGALAEVQKGDVTVGGDLAVTAGPLGRNTSASTDHRFDAEIYSYSRSKGVFAGITLSGSNLWIDRSANSSFYGKGTTSQAIFERATDTSKAVKQLKITLSSI